MNEFSLYIDNGLNQTVTVQIKANRKSTVDKSVNVGASFTVAADSTDARTLTSDTSGFLPYITVTLQCSTAPTSGQCSIYKIHSNGEEKKVVDAIEIRDTSLHNNSTNPLEIFVINW